MQTHYWASSAGNVCTVSAQNGVRVMASNELGRERQGRLPYGVPSGYITSPVPSDESRRPAQQEGGKKAASSTTTSPASSAAAPASAPVYHDLDSPVNSELLFPCGVCGKSFVSIRNLRSHEKSHNKDRPYRCMDCGKAFAARNSLLCHTRVHTKERPYSCSTCGKAFTQASSLKSHVIYKHTKKFPYECKQCGRGFISPGQRVEHAARIHGTSVRKQL